MKWSDTTSQKKNKIEIQYDLFVKWNSVDFDLFPMHLWWICKVRSHLNATEKDPDINVVEARV